jgi:hypothetical protein
VPHIGPQLPWTAIGSDSEGENLVLAFTASSPLTESELARLKQATWRTAENRLTATNFVEIGEPQTTPQDTSVQRGTGNGRDSDSVTADKYLGQLGKILHDLKCYYQGVIFKVYPAGHRAAQ